MTPLQWNYCLLACLTSRESTTLLFQSLCSTLQQSMSFHLPTFSQHWIYLISLKTYIMREEFSLIWEYEQLNDIQVEEDAPVCQARTFDDITPVSFHGLRSPLSIQPLLRNGAGHTFQRRRHKWLSQWENRSSLCTKPGLPIWKGYIVILGLPHTYTGDSKDIRQVVSVLGIPTAQVLMIAVYWMLLSLILPLEGLRLVFTGSVWGMCGRGDTRI